jgi:acyl carrier protein
MVVGGIGRYTFIKEYLHLTYHGHEFDTKEAKFLLDELKNEEYIEQTVKRIQQPFSHMISTLAQVRWVLNVKFNFDYDSIRPEANIYNEFVIDSLEMMSMLMEVEYYFGVRIDLESIEDEKILTIQDLMDYLDLKRGKKSGKNLYPNQVLEYLDVEFTPLYPSQNLFRNPLV